MPKALATFVLAATFALPAPAVAALDLSLPDMGQPADQVMSPAEERDIGQRMMHQIRQQASLIDDPAVVGYLRDLGIRLAGYSELPPEAYELFLIEDGRLNAFAMPGGFIGLHSGLLLSADSESELASVIAHEMAHVSQRHLARRVLASQGTNLRTLALVLAGILIGTQNPQAGSATTLSGLAGAAQSQLAYSREHEREADRLGLRLLARAGFDPEGMPEFFGQLLEKSRYSPSPPPFLSTHPLTEQRLAETRERAAKFETQEEPFESPNFALMRARLAALTAHSGPAAVQRLRGWLDEPDANAAARYGLTVALVRAGKLETANEELARLTREQPERSAFYLTQADLALAADRPAAALTAIEDGLSLFPDDYALRYRQVEALVAAQQPRDALDAADSAIERHDWATELLALKARAADAAGETAEAALAMGRYYAARGELRSALHQIDDVLAQAGADGYQRSRARALKKRWQEALASRPEGG